MSPCICLGVKTHPFTRPGLNSFMPRASVRLLYLREHCLGAYRIGNSHTSKHHLKPHDIFEGALLKQQCLRDLDPGLAYNGNHRVTLSLFATNPSAAQTVSSITLLTSRSLILKHHRHYIVQPYSDQHTVKFTLAVDSCFGRVCYTSGTRVSKTCPLDSMRMARSSVSHRG
jgi:hypothetical protein